MQKIGFFTFCFAFFTAVNISAQRQQPVPVPVAETEIREGSTRLRSIELERVKRDAGKIAVRDAGKEQAVKFSLIEADFAKIQKTQDAIIRAYTTGEKIDYEKIGGAARDLTKQAHRLAVNLFGENFETNDPESETRGAKRKSVRDLIIELDNTLGVFVTNPIFQNIKIVNPDSSEKARFELKKIFILSDELFKAASNVK